MRIKNLLVLVTLFISSNIFCFGQELRLSLNELKKHYKFKNVVKTDLKLPPFPSIEVIMVSYTEEMKTPMLIYALEKGKKIAAYGAVIGNDYVRYILYDLNGDGNFNYKASINNNYIPNWVLFKSKVIKRGDTKDFLRFCDEIYADFNNMHGPKNIQSNIKKLIDIVNDTKVVNRDLYYSLLSYTIYEKQPDLEFDIMYELQKEVMKRSKGKTSMLFFLYIGGAFESAGDNEFALKTFYMLKEMDPNSIIAEYYIAKLEDKQNKSTSQIKAFKQKHPTFWTLKQK